METKRLRTIQQPSHLERLLDAYITRGDMLPKDATRSAIPTPWYRCCGALSSRPPRKGESGPAGSVAPSNGFSPRRCRFLYPASGVHRFSPSIATATTASSWKPATGYSIQMDSGDAAPTEDCTQTRTVRAADLVQPRTGYC